MNDKITIDGVVYVREQEPEKTEKPEPWTPPEGECYITTLGDVRQSPSNQEGADYSNEFDIPEEAQEQAELTKGWQWLCALARHVNPSGRCMKPSEFGHSIRVDEMREGFSWTGMQEGISAVFQARKAAEAAIEIMNRDKDRWKEIVG